MSELLEDDVLNGILIDLLTGSHLQDGDCTNSTIISPNKYKGVVLLNCNPEKWHISVFVYKIEYNHKWEKYLIELIS